MNECKYEILEDTLHRIEWIKLLQFVLQINSLQYLSKGCTFETNWNQSWNSTLPIYSILCEKSLPMFKLTIVVFSFSWIESLCPSSVFRIIMHEHIVRYGQELTLHARDRRHDHLEQSCNEDRRRFWRSALLRVYYMSGTCINCPLH